MKLHEPIESMHLSRPVRAPNFFIIGAAKSGTTALWHQLRQHPQIFMHREKQLNFFAIDEDAKQFRGPPPLQKNRYATRTWDDYCSEFSEASDQTAIGEACNSYLYSPRAAARIKNCLPNARLIAVLRHPAERAQSRFLQLVRSGRESITTFGDALAEERKRIDEHWWPEFHYLHVGMYHEQLRRYYAVFPPEQIRVYLYEDMLTGPSRMLRDIFQYLEVRADFIPNMEVHYSASGLPKSKGVDWILNRLRTARPLAEKLLQRKQLDYLLLIASRAHVQNLVKPQLTPEARDWLIRQYRDDTLRLQDLIQRDLSAWLR